MITKDSKSILIADDSLFFRTKLSDILVEAGHKVRFAKDGKDVISEIRIDSGGIDLLILDLQMPIVDGFKVLDWINDNGFRNRFPVLAVTGVYEPGTVIERVRALGAAGLVTKGFTPEQIVLRINRILFPDKVTERKPPPRVAVSVPADFTVGDVTSTGFLLNVSEGGAFLHTKTELLSGTMLNIKFSLPGIGRVFEARGRVQWSTGEAAAKTLFGGSGIMFTAIPDEDKEVLKQFVAAEVKRLGLEE